MRKTMCVILGLVLLAMGILGITGLMTMFQSSSIYVNIGEIVLGGLGLVVGVYARQSRADLISKTEAYQQSKEINQQGKEINQRGKEIDLQGKEIDQQSKEIDQQSKEINQQKKEISQQKKEITERDSQRQ